MTLIERYGVTSTTFIGNIDILPTKILNYDLRWELFQEDAQMYEDFKIEEKH